MSGMSDLYQRADWKTEKHVPVIELPEKARPGENFPLRISVGKGVAHPNRTEHHISWMEVYFLPEGSKFPVLVGRTDFSAHGASVQGPDTSGVYAEPEVALSFRTERRGKVIAVAYCNIHGLWEGSLEVDF